MKDAYFVLAKNWLRLAHEIERAAGGSMSFVCPSCAGTGWVCKNHRDRPWQHMSNQPDACNCGAGAPCPECNHDEPPRVGWDGEPVGNG